MPVGDSELEYFRRIEDAFIRLRGTPFLLSPSDWRLASEWRQQGIPAQLVCRALEELFARRRQSGQEGKVQSLTYCASAVEDAWRQQRELGTRGSGPDAQMDVAARLSCLARALPENLAERGRWVERILGAGVRPQEAERVLAQLDGELTAFCLAGLGAEQRAAAEAEVERALAAPGRPLAPEVLAADRERLLREAARRVWALPLLSLFSPSARSG